jgi:hypothetical protein
VWYTGLSFLELYKCLWVSPHTCVWRMRGWQQSYITNWSPKYVIWNRQFFCCWRVLLWALSRNSGIAPINNQSIFGNRHALISTISMLTKTWSTSVGKRDQMLSGTYTSRICRVIMIYSRLTARPTLMMLHIHQISGNVLATWHNEFEFPTRAHVNTLLNAVLQRHSTTGF